MGSRTRSRRGVDYWPGFVDALASLLMVMIFVILIFTLGQFALTDAVSGRDKALARLNAELAALAQTLSLEQSARASLAGQADELRASLAREAETRGALEVDLGRARAALEAQTEAAARLGADVAALQRLKAELEAEVARLAGALDTSEKTRGELAEVSDRALAQVELLNRQLAAVRGQLDELNKALETARNESAAKELKLEELGRELNLALAARVQELARYRSEFFGRLRAALGEREGVAIVGDRFVFPSEVLFPSGSADVSEDGLRQLTRLGETLKDIARDIPSDLPWVLQVDGHTDRRPIATARYPSNWELSTARAVAIVKFLRDQGVPAARLAATGYGEYHPLDPGSTDAAHARNRRIELKLTNR
ncbi:peptidoglycan -binding protein [Thauera phenolivorans]|nr:peptidoglycan -binding protein [Thauera phenolivorans]